MTTWTLLGHGRLPWQAARRILDNYTCAWIDLAGPHLGPPPDLPPLTSHLWGWAPGRYARARIDQEAAYLGELHEGAPNPHDGEQVTVLIRQAIPLLAAADAPADLHSLAFDLLDVPGPAPVTFVRARAQNPTSR